jgi:Domain of unknown function (DUF5666)
MMKQLYLTTTPSLDVRFNEWRRSVVAGILMVFAVLAVVACGGGGSSVASVGSGGTGTVGTVNTFNIGTITGFGSVFVNGVRFDDSSASVNDEDGARSLNDLRLGMVVRVQGSVNASGSATASSFAFDSELLGPVRSINTGSKTLVILGQTVVVDTNTVFDSSLPSGFSSLQATQTIEVHGYLNPSANTLQATFVELKNNPNRYKLSGTVTNLQSISKTFQIGQETINFTGTSTTDIPAGVANGQLIKVRLTPSTSNSGGELQAGSLRSGSSNLPSNNDRTNIEGLVSAVTSATQFSVDGVQIDARNASFTNGSVGLVVGARVEVKGALVSGTLVATEIKLKQSNSGSGGSSGSGSSGGGSSASGGSDTTTTGGNTSSGGSTSGGGTSGGGTSGGGTNGGNSTNGSTSTDVSSTEIELRGPISNLNPNSKTFVVRGVVVSFGGTVQYDGGSQANLINGATVQVKGQTSITSSTITATRLKFEN